MATKSDLEGKFLEKGFNDYRWIDPKKIIVSQWVRMKCMFGCPEYGRNASCPPNTPSVSECERFLQEYKDAAVFHFAKKVAKPEDRHAWTKKINLNLLELEKEIFLSGYRKAFLLVVDSCGLCEQCTGNRQTCKQPKLSRPTPEGMGVDVFATVRQLGYPIEVLKGYSEIMNRYAILLID
jgi:predicted metal-binding protein